MGAGAARGAASTRRREPASPPRVLLADDHPLWRQTIRKLLESHQAATVVAEAADGAEAIRQAQDVQPDVVLMDIDMPGVDGVTAIRELQAVAPAARTLVLSGSDRRSQVAGAVRAGAAGYVLKTADSEEIVDAVRRIAGGELVFPAALSQVVLAELRGDGRPLPRSAVVGDDVVLRREGLARVLADLGIDDVRSGPVHEVASAAADVAVVAGDAARHVAAVQDLRAARPDAPVVVLIDDLDAAAVERLLEVGTSALGCLRLDAIEEVEALRDAICRVAAGEVVVDAALAGDLVGRGRAGAPVAGLTPAEAEVLALMAEGRSNAAIADRVFVSVKTVESRVASIFSKLGLEPGPDDHRRVLAVLAHLSGRAPSAG